MSTTNQYRKCLLATIVAGSFLFGRCAKDKIPVEEPVKPTKWELIEGDYKVYDTLGTFLYDMSINHLKSQFIDFDSLRFENLDNNFVFGEQQSFYTDLYINFFTFGHHSLLLDNDGNSWKMIDVGNLPYNNFQNDTIKLKFRVTNINLLFVRLGAIL